MEWLLRNWIWIFFAVGVFLLMRRGGLACGMGHGGHAQTPRDSADQIANSDNGPKDPISGARVNSEGSVNSMYQGRLYYFETRENRDKFEASPAQYASATAGDDDAHRHHRHGC
jgi:YHS domain-containing protein